MIGLFDDSTHPSPGTVTKDACDSSRARWGYVGTRSWPLVRESELEAIESVELLADDLRRAREYEHHFVLGPQAAAELVDALNEVAKMARRRPNEGPLVADEKPVEGFSKQGRRVLGGASP